MRIFQVGAVLIAIVATTTGFQALQSRADRPAGHCARGVQPCNAGQVGQPCNPNKPNVICSAQADGAYCCLAYAP